MKIIRPIAITEAMLVDSNVPEYLPTAWSSGTDYVIGDWVSSGTDVYEAILDSGPSGVGSQDPTTPDSIYWTYVSSQNVPLWDVGTTYALGDLVVKTETHRIYESIFNGANLGNDPELEDALSPVNWIDAGASYPWRAFDGVIGSVDKVTRTGSITYAIKPGLYKGIGLLNIIATQVNVTMIDNDAGNTEVYNETKLTTALADADSDVIVVDWYSYFFSDVRFITDLVFLDLPPFLGATTYITLSQSPGVEVELGEIVIGTVIDLGVTQYAPEFTIVDYSRKERDPYGGFTVVERAYSKRVDVRTIVPNYSINNVTNTLTELRATPVLWITTEIPIYDTTLLVYGYFKDFKIVIPHSRWAEMNLQIEGLT